MNCDIQQGNREYHKASPIDCDGGVAIPMINII